MSVPNRLYLMSQIKLITEGNLVLRYGQVAPQQRTSVLKTIENSMSRKTSVLMS